MGAAIHALSTALATGAEAARRRAMLLHPSNYIPANPEPSPAIAAAADAEDHAARFEYLYRELVGQGLPKAEARTEVARIAAGEVWDGFAARLRRCRAEGRQMDANVLAVALTSMQGMTLPLVRRPGNVASACRAVATARRRLLHNGGLLHRLHRHVNPAFGEADATLRSLEAFLVHEEAKAA